MKKFVLEYRGCSATVEYSEKDHVFYGKIEGIKDLVNFESENIEGVEREFRNAVDDYLRILEELEKT